MKWILFVCVVAVTAVRPAEHVEKHVEKHAAGVEKVDCCNCEITSDFFTSTKSCKMFESIKVSKLSSCAPGSGFAWFCMVLHGFSSFQDMKASQADAALHT